MGTPETLQSAGKGNDSLMTDVVRIEMVTAVQ